MTATKTMQERYLEYNTTSYAAKYSDTPLMSFDEFASREKEKDTKQAQAELLAATITEYDTYIEKALAGDEDGARVLSAMRRHHNGICEKLYEEGRIDQIAGHRTAYSAAVRRIRGRDSRDKGRVVARKAFVATNIYDDDDSPKTIVW